MQSYPKQPIVDVQNPCYCPSVPARAYIHVLHQRLARTSGIARTFRVINSFPHILGQVVKTPGVDPGDKGVDDSDWETSGSSSSSNTSTSTATPHSSTSEEKGSGNELDHSSSERNVASALDTHGSATSTGASENISFDMNHLTTLNGFGRLRDSRLLACPPCKRKESHHTSGSEDSDLRGPSKRAKSLPGTEQRSFEVRLKRESLKFDLPSSKHLDSVECSVSSISSLPSLDLEFLHIPRPTTPEIKGPSESERLTDEIKQVGHWTLSLSGPQRPQATALYLAENGLLTAPLMAMIGKYPSVRDLSLSASLNEHHGLNIGRASELLPALHAPGQFTGLTNLSCNQVTLKDDDMVYFHNLPLESLSLYCTGISNAAVFLLVSHRHTLLQLFIGANPRIDDDAIPALMMFKKLTQLKINGTQIKMDGLRRYATDIRRQERIIHIEIPENCQNYLSGLSSQYLIDIEPLLIADSENVWRASLTELRRNLAAHSAVNKTISTAGNKSELRERLMKLLQRRKDDLLVKEMLEKGAGLGLNHGGFAGAVSMNKEGSDDDVSLGESDEED